MDLRCDAKKHAVLDDEFIEVKCDSRWCGAGKGVVVLHRFDLTGKLITTQRLKDPGRKRGEARGSAHIASVRAS